MEADKQNIQFKVLRAADPSVIGGTMPVEVSKSGSPAVHFPNCKGGLRLASIEDVRASAAASAERTKKRLAQI